MKPGLLLGMVLVAGLALGAEEPMPLAPLPVNFGVMGNGGPLALPGRCEMGIDTGKSMDGKPVYSIRCANDALPSFGGTYYTLVDPQYRGKRVRVSAWLMTSAVEDMSSAQYPLVAGAAGLWLAVGSQRAGSRADRMENRAVKGSSDWVLRDFVADVPEDNSRLQIGLWMQGKGQLWVRDFKVEEVPTTVQVNFFWDDPQHPPGPDLSLQTTLLAGDAPIQAPPSKWMAIGGQGFELCDAGVDTQMFRQGQPNLSISCGIPATPALRQSILASPWWGKRVRFSGWVKTENFEPLPTDGGPGGAGLWLNISGSQIPTFHSNVNIKQQGEWQYRELVADIPRNSSWILMGLGVSGRGQAWARDFKFEEVTADVPVTPPGPSQ